MQPVSDNLQFLVDPARGGAIKSGKYDLIILNFANPDMVGHTGVLEAAIEAAQELGYNAVVGDADATTVTVDADITLSGPAAQFGRVGLIKEMSSRLIVDFVDCLEAKLAAETAEEAEAISSAEVGGITLFFSSLWAQIVRFFGRLFGRSTEL